jgi:hypothetical protein
VVEPDQESTMADFSKITVLDLPDNIISDLVINYNEIDYYFGEDGKHEFWMRWKYLLPQTAGSMTSFVTEFLEMEGKLFLLPIPKCHWSLIKSMTVTFSKDNSRALMFLSLDVAKTPEQLGVYFTGAIAVAELYEHGDYSFYLGRYLHQSYLVGLDKRL